MKTKTISLVTGGSFGIGRSCAIALAKRGDFVIVSDCVEDTGTVNSIKDFGGEAAFARCDVSNESDIQYLLRSTVRKYGRLDNAFNNAGIEGERGGTAVCSSENFDRVISVNLRGVWLCMKYELEYMLNQEEGGSIVNNTSIAGLVGVRDACALTASKHGVIGLTKTAALEYSRKNIRVNSVCPGFIKSPLIDRFTGKKKVIEEAILESRLAELQPMGRLGEPGEVADAVVWLLSRKASFVTGQTIIVDGGWVAQ